MHVIGLKIARDRMNRCEKSASQLSKEMHSLSLKLLKVYARVYTFGFPFLSHVPSVYSRASVAQQSGASLAVLTPEHSACACCSDYIPRDYSGYVQTAMLYA